MQGYLKNWAVFVTAYSILSPFYNLDRPLQNEETEEKKFIIESWTLDRKEKSMWKHLLNGL